MIWASAALLTTLALAPEPIGQLKLSNDRVCHGLLGWERKDTKNPKLFPGDIYILTFDVEGLTVSDTGRINYSTTVELSDKAGKVVFKDEPTDFEGVAGLGGKRVSANAQIITAIDTPVGTYTIKVTVTDKAAKNVSATLMRTFDVVPIDLGFVRLVVDLAVGQGTPPPAPPLAVPGQIYLVNFAVVGYKLDAKTNEPNFKIEMSVLDDTGRPVLKEPFRGGITEVPEKWKKVMPMQFTLGLNRPGKFRIVLKVTDTIAKKTAEQTLDFQVLEPR
jgi:hypothetical protein